MPVPHKKKMNKRLNGLMDESMSRTSSTPTMALAVSGGKSSSNGKGRISGHIPTPGPLREEAPANNAVIPRRKSLSFHMDQSPTALDGGGELTKMPDEDDVHHFSEKDVELSSCIDGNNSKERLSAELKKADDYSAVPGHEGALRVVEYDASDFSRSFQEMPDGLKRRMRVRSSRTHALRTGTHLSVC